MTGRLPILEHGTCEPVKAAVHGATLSLAVVMALYNAAAWLHRRERHLWINALVYCLLTEYERRLVAHHVNACRIAVALTQTADGSAQPDAPHAA